MNAKVEFGAISNDPMTYGDEEIDEKTTSKHLMAFRRSSRKRINNQSVQVSLLRESEASDGDKI